MSSKLHYSLAFSITGEVAPGIRFKFLIETEIDSATAEEGIDAFIGLIERISLGQVSEAELEALLTHKPIGGTVLVAFDAATGKIIPVNALERLPTSR